MSGPPRRLRRELRTIEVLGLSVAMMSPVLAMALYSGAPAIYVGQAAPLAFVLSGVAIAFVGAGIMYLCRYFSHAGSVYGLTGLTLGPRAGFVAGWALLGCYALFAVSSALTAGYFAARLCRDTGMWHTASYFPFTLLAFVLVLLLARRDVKRLGRVLLSIEAISIVVMTVLLVTILIKLIGGSHGHSASLSVFTLPAGDSVHALVLASVFGLASFAGFEGAASLGEETENPRRNVPRALVIAIIAGVALYVVCSAIIAMGFGADAAGGKALASSGGPLFSLAHEYVSSSMANVLEVGVMFSGFSAALGTVMGAARLLFAFARDGRPRSRLAGVGSAGEPGNAINLTVGFGIALTVAFRISNIDGLSGVYYTGTLGTLSLLTAYALVNVGAGRLMLRERANRVLVLLPVIAFGLIAYLMYNEVYPRPPYPYDIFPYVIGGWLLIGIGLVFISPNLASRLGRGLAAFDRTPSEGGGPVEPVELPRV